MLRHLHFVQAVDPLYGGGLGRAALDLSEAIRTHGGRSALLTTKRGGSETSPGIRAFRRIGPTKAFFSTDLWEHRDVLMEECDILHGHGFYSAMNLVLGLAARAHRVPLVYHVHGIFEPWILARSRWKKRIAHFLFENANFRYASLWRALTLKEADQIRAQGIKAPIVVCPNGVELRTFASVAGLRSAAAKSGRSLLFLARIHPKKGLDILVEAWASLPKRERDGWSLTVAGPDELGHRAEIEMLAQRLGVSNELKFVGEVSGESKLRCLAGADAFVLPSRSEGFSVAILEAMACRLPVLATTACNFPELAADGGGWCVEPSVTGVKEGLGALLRASERELTERGNVARSLVEARYAWPQIAETISGACDSLFIKGDCANRS